MLKIDSVEKGLVLDHIQAGKAMEIYKYLNLDKMDCSVAIIKNAKIQDALHRLSRKLFINSSLPTETKIYTDVYTAIRHMRITTYKGMERGLNDSR